MSTWPTGWRQHALRHADVPITQFALDVLHSWEQATPTDRWTNNPLGMPASGYSAQRAFASPYAAFPTMQEFYTAFRTAVHAGHGKPLLTALGAQDKYSVAWRAISQLNWPASKTETDYPTHLLDRVTEGLPKGWKTHKPEDRKTVGGTAHATTETRIAATQAAALHHASSNINDAARGIEYIVRRMGQHG